MAITERKTDDGKKVYEVYVTGWSSAGIRIQKRKTKIESLQKAKQIEFELKREIALLKEAPVPLRWHEWFDECMKRMSLDFMPSTVYCYKRLEKWIHPHFKMREIGSITKAEIHDVIYSKIGSEITSYSRRNILKMTRRIFQMAVEDGLIDRNPCNGISVKVAEVDHKVLTTEEVGIFLREAKACHHKFYTVWTFALLTGMRSGEMYALRWSDIDLEQGIILVTKQWTSKNGYCPTKSRRNRVVPVSNDLHGFLKELKAGKNEDDFVLPRISEWEHGEQARVTKEFCAGIGITPVKFHDLRATFITNMLSQGVPLARVMSIVGHSELKTTNAYLRRAGVEIKGATEALGYKIPVTYEQNVVSMFKK